MNSIDHAKWEVQEALDHAASALVRAEDAQRRLNRDDLNRCIEHLARMKEQAEWAVTKAQWAIDRIKKIQEAS
ncbi:hypothetical protein [Cupriavidus malaysiensis]|uniref:Uncharacterized protein n=1 Tax=Cupriavidus malaysiensis TaxID=367825 RepID=A0ABM6F5L4_9BURK|nr:hypothetical protein [Cupriavidus malaysiensis]AOZ06799.1 hypothetical protein BKK80_13950 [Cupriavidus malaysiensis]